MSDNTPGFDNGAVDIQAREEMILGHPPRIPPIPRESVADEIRAVTNRLRGGIVGDHAPLPLDAIPEIMFTMCRYPALWDRIMALSLHLQGQDHGAVPAPAKRNRRTAAPPPAACDIADRMAAPGTL
ncbi:hypothetical protein LWE61_08000 [Sphingobium sufflavum]|nr:hypothetical protein [Sphingobium sufflavum]